MEQLARNYVKFVRGSLSAYQRLVSENRVSDDTLYFVYENKESDNGYLYLGKKLISDGVNEILNFSELGGVNLGGEDNPLCANDILIYDKSSGEWVNASVKYLIGEQLSEINSLRYENAPDGINAIVKPQAGTIYLVPEDNGSDFNKFSEYLYIKDNDESGHFESLGGNADVTILEKKVTNLEDILNGTEKEIIDEETQEPVIEKTPGLIYQVNEIIEALTWEEI